MRGHGADLQCSVFRCDLSARERVVLAALLEDAIDRDEDPVVVVRLGPVDGHADGTFDALGCPQWVVWAVQSL